MAKKVAKKPELKVAFDTNAIFTDSAAFLLKREVTDLVRANSSHSDISIRWYLPEIVRCEREFQMRENGIALLPSIQKIERVLGHNLNITEAVMVTQIEQIITKQLAETGVEVLPLDVTRVDWPRVIKDSAYRVPPFEKGDKEKGFRDLLVLETIAQLVEDSPSTPRVCRIALVTNDGQLAVALRSRASQFGNVRILMNLEDLRGLINTLVGEVGEEFVAAIQQPAAKYFFEKGNTESLYYREKVRDQIRTKFAKNLATIPKGSSGKDLANVWVGTTRFSKKEKQRVHWATRITFEYHTYRFESATPALLTDYLSLYGSDPKLAPTFAWLPESSPESPSLLNPFQKIPGLSGTSVGSDDPNVATPRNKKPHNKEKLEFDVNWSVTVTTQRHNLSSGKVDSVDFVETTVEPL